jgi:tRNA (uracil-5-)-methyltransferase
VAWPRPCETELMPLSLVQPEHYESLLSKKITAVGDLLNAFSPPAPEIYGSEPTGYRLRAEFKMWHDSEDINYVMFRPDDPGTPIVITEFPIACKLIQQSMPILRDALKADSALRRKLFQVEFLTSLSGDLLVTLIYHRKLDDAWEATAHVLLSELRRHTASVSVIGRSRKQKLVLGKDFIQEVLTIDGEKYRYRQYEQSFSQPNGLVNIRMIEWACRQASVLQGDLLELYCGNGNFTLPLSRHFDHVIATEVSKSSIRAASANLLENGIHNVQLVRLSAAEVAEATSAKRIFRRLSGLPKPLNQFNLKTLFVDPPRAGLDEHTVEMASHFSTIIYISCNPHTLAQNLQALQPTHSVERLAMFDQFPYTNHMECGVVLQRR